MDDGTDKTSKAGDVLNIPPGHDAWVVGNEPAVVLDFQSIVDYAKQGKARGAGSEYPILPGAKSNREANAILATGVCRKHSRISLLEKNRDFAGWRAAMQKTEHKTFARPDDTREFPRGRAEILKVGGGEVGRLVFQPGWRWSNDLKPIARTPSCEAPHFQYHVSGRLAIRMDDGTEFVAGPGDVTSLPSGHDAWVVGDEPVVVVDWFGASNYAKSK